MDLNEYQIDKEVISMVPDDLCRRNQLLPLSIVNGRIAVAMANPKNFAAVDDVSATTGMPVIAMVAMPSQVRDCINRFLRANAELTELSHEIAATAKKEVDLEQDDSEDASPVARFVSLLINQAIDDHCSDIHIEPQEDGLLVRYRIDGVLHIFQKAPRAMTQDVVSRIKVMAEMDIGERRKPQDGRITVRHNGQKVDRGGIAYGVGRENRHAYFEHAFGQSQSGGSEFQRTQFRCVFQSVQPPVRHGVGDWSDRFG